MDSSDSDYFKENVHMFDALDFWAGRPAEFTQHIPPKRLQLIRRYGLYASRTKGRWEQMPHVAERAPEGWKTSHPDAAPHADHPGFEPFPDGQEVDINSRKRAWARLLAKIYEGCAPRSTPSCARNTAQR